MGFEDSLRHARELLIAEINELREELAKKEYNLRKLDSFLKEPQSSNTNGYSLTKNIVEIVYRLVAGQKQAVTAKAVVQEFYKHNKDVNESTIRSTLYQVTKKQKPTEIIVNGNKLAVEIIKDGPTYDVTVVGTDEQELKHANA
ncbi:MAG: hypothetical protein GX994_07360 [Firmicutes bacterium]|nr:hypothetical protein [Bacillota bacterium]